jgi:excisionase family DNA binding protein
MSELALTIPDDLVERIARRAADLVAERDVPAPQTWLTVAEAADYLRCPESRIYALTSARRIPFEKDGSRTLLNRDALDQWVRDGGGIRP